MFSPLLIGRIVLSSAPIPKLKSGDPLPPTILILPAPRMLSPLIVLMFCPLVNVVCASVIPYPLIVVGLLSTSADTFMLGRG